MLSLAVCVSVLSAGHEADLREDVLAALEAGKRQGERAGFKHCWQNRDYRTIIAVAQRIPEDVLQEDPKLLMWYDQAVTRTGGEQ